jgi:hypothetical protein
MEQSRSFPAGDECTGMKEVYFPMTVGFMSESLTVEIEDHLDPFNDREPGNPANLNLRE